MPPITIVWRAVLAAAVAAVGIHGAVAGAALLSRRGREGEGSGEPWSKALQSGARVLLSSLVIALVLAILISLGGLWGLSQGLGLGFLVWLGIAAAGLEGSPPSGRWIGGYLLRSGHQLASLLVMAAILALWR